MSKFLPYKYIKELYNPERAVSPAVRDQVQNTIFLGKAEEQGETLLDNHNIPFFDLWIYIINFYKQNIYETVRSELLVVPDLMAVLPPICNVVYPNEYLHYGRDINLRALPTRFFEQGFHTIPGITGSDQVLNDTIALSQEAFVAPTTDVQPDIYKVIAGECAGTELADNGNIPEGEEWVKFTQIPLEEEFHYGANYQTGGGEYLIKMGQNFAIQNEGLNTSGEDSLSLKEEYDNFNKLNVLYKYFMARMLNQKIENVRITFSPRLIPGCSILLLSRTGRHLAGLITNLEHHISASGIAETLVTVDFQYVYDDASKRPLYFYRDKNIELEALRGQGEEEEFRYVWKNNFMLSNNFRDKFVGNEIYSKILCDGISNNDYNYFAEKHRDLKDKSILGIHSILKSFKSSSKDGTLKEKYGDILHNYDLLDDIYIDQDSTTSTGETYFENIDNIKLSKDLKLMKGQQNNFFTAVDKLWKGYQAAADKESFIKQFDIYPMRDFDEYMASLGAERSGKDFKGIGEKTDWAGQARKEMESRYKRFKAQVQEREDQTPEDEALNLISNEITSVRSTVNEEDTLSSKNQEKLELLQNVKSIGELKKRKRELSAKIKELRNEGKEQEAIKLENEREKIADQIGSIDTKKWDDFVKGIAIDRDTQKKVMEVMEKNQFTRDVKKSTEGFTTQGPFCLQKQNYFLNIFRPSIVHWDSEFREASPTKVKVQDEGNNILINTQKIVKPNIIGETNSDITLEIDNKKLNISKKLLGNLRVDGYTPFTLLNQLRSTGKITESDFNSVRTRLLEIYVDIVKIQKTMVLNVVNRPNEFISFTGLKIEDYNKRKQELKEVTDFIKSYEGVSDSEYNRIIHKKITKFDVNVEGFTRRYASIFKTHSEVSDILELRYEYENLIKLTKKKYGI